MNTTRFGPATCCGSDSGELPEDTFDSFCAGVRVSQTVGNCSGLVQKVCQQFNAVDDAIYTQ